jgi:hypothetical protein
MTATLLSVDQLRQQIRVRLAQGRLPLASGGYKTRPGTGHPCAVCRRGVEALEVESGVGDLTAHDACYMLWREESVARLMAMRPQSPEGSR